MEFFDFNGKVVLEFFGNSCLNCQMMTPIMNNIEYIMSNIRFYRINADARPDLVQKFNITSLPTLLLFNNNQLVSTIVGVKSQHVLQAIINQALI